MSCKLLRAGGTWAIRRSCCCEDLSYGRNRWLVNKVFSAASHSRITITLTSTYHFNTNYCTVTSDCGFTVAGSITRVTGQPCRLQHDRYLPPNYVQKAGRTQGRVAVVCKGKAAFANDCICRGENNDCLNTILYEACPNFRHVRPLSNAKATC